jgi:3-dehydroquinate dehydratase I
MAFREAEPITSLREVREAAQQNGVKLILSYHNFEATPSKAYMLGKLYSSEFHGGDIGKIAVMPNSMEDVLNVLQVTHEASRHVHIPIITMSMGTQGALTRLIGWKFGSALTFAVGSQSSAPGQIPIEVMQQVERYVTDDIN